MESAYCAGFKEIGDDIESRAPRSPFERDPELADGKVWSGIHELRKSAQLPDDPQIGFAVGETPKEEDLKQELMGSGAAAGLGSEKAQGTAASPADEGMCVPHRDSTAPRDAAH